jgi:hypothetical protein
MPKFKTKAEAYESCQETGCFRKLSNINNERIRSLVINADTNIDSAKTLSKCLQKEDKKWLNVYTMHYEAIRIYTEALLISNKIMSENHQCLFAYLCVEMPDLGFDWNFFENIRRKRNGVNYYGEQISYQEWKSLEAQFDMYIGILKKEIGKRLNQFK